MKTYGLVCAVLLSAFALAADAPKDTRFFEMRTYYAAEGKLDALNARFRNHTCKLFEKHGMTNIGYWMPLDNPDRKLIYVLAYPSREAREKSWKDFMADPDWQAVVKESEKDGKLLAKIESLYLNATDFSPEAKPTAENPARVFELRIYKATENHLPDLLARFRDHTVKLFAKHGMTQIAYWTPADKNKGADDTLVYILAHKSKEAAAESFGTFRKDPDWIAAKKASEDKAGGPLTVQPQEVGVKSVFMAPTDYSPMK
ncbi:MAG TPA: NIPSNAP family protein [Planctomycetota bacterium]|jgi:hypothetical protein